MFKKAFIFQKLHVILPYPLKLIKNCDINIGMFQDIQKILIEKTYF